MNMKMAYFHNNDESAGNDRLGAMPGVEIVSWSSRGWGGQSLAEGAGTICWRGWNLNAEILAAVNSMDAITR